MTIDQVEPDADDIVGAARIVPTSRLAGDGPDETDEEQDSDEDSGEDDNAAAADHDNDDELLDPVRAGSRQGASASSPQHPPTKPGPTRPLPGPAPATPPTEPEPMPIDDPPPAGPTDPAPPQTVRGTVTTESPDGGGASDQDIDTAGTEADPERHAPDAPA